MGLTLYYTLTASKSKTTSLADVVLLLGKLRGHCLEQDFVEVGEIVTYECPGDPMDPSVYEAAELAEQWWFSESTSMLLWTDRDSSEDPEIPPGIPGNVMASEAAMFNVLPADGCETARFGLAAYPPELGGQKTRAADGWYMNDFCKTQYASKHGDDAFSAAHIGLIGALDFAKELGIAVEVRDEGGYWESRDKQALLEANTLMNRRVAHFAGAFKDAAEESGRGGEVVAPIFEHPKFEHLEAEGEAMEREKSDR